MPFGIYLTEVLNIYIKKEKNYSHSHWGSGEINLFIILKINRHLGIEIKIKVVGDRTRSKIKRKKLQTHKILNIFHLP